MRTGGAADGIGERLSEKPLAVIGGNDGIGLGDGAVEVGGDAVEFLRGKLKGALAIDAHDLLAAGDDAGFEDGGESGALENAGGIDAGGAEQFEQTAGGPIGSDGTGERDAIGELAEVAGDVGGAAGIVGFAGDVDGGDGRFGRNARGLAPDELVQHEVAGNEDTLAGEPRGEGVEASGIRFHAGRRLRRRGARRAAAGSRRRSCARPR